MATVTKSKKPARKAVRRRPAREAKLPAGMEISPVTGLAVVKARPGQKPVTSAQIKALMADVP